MHDVLSNTVVQAFCAGEASQIHASHSASDCFWLTPARICQCVWLDSEQLGKTYLRSLRQSQRSLGAGSDAIINPGKKCTPISNSRQNCCTCCSSPWKVPGLPLCDEHLYVRAHLGDIAAAIMAFIIFIRVIRRLVITLLSIGSMGVL